MSRAWQRKAYRAFETRLGRLHPATLCAAMRLADALATFPHSFGEAI